MPRKISQLTSLFVSLAPANGQANLVTWQPQTDKKMSPWQPQNSQINSFLWQPRIAKNFFFLASSEQSCNFVSLEATNSQVTATKACPIACCSAWNHDAKHRCTRKIRIQRFHDWIQHVYIICTTIELHIYPYHLS